MTLELDVAHEEAGRLDISALPGAHDAGHARHRARTLSIHAYRFSPAEAIISTRFSGVIPRDG